MWSPCSSGCPGLLNVNEQIILDEIKKHLLQRDDNYLEQIKKEKDASATIGSLPSADAPFPAGSIPPADMPPIEVDDDVPPPLSLIHIFIIQPIKHHNNENKHNISQETCHYPGMRHTNYSEICH